jgi:hypothetical protein
MSFAVETSCSGYVLAQRAPSGKGLKSLQFKAHEMRWCDLREVSTYGHFEKRFATDAWPRRPIALWRAMLM